MKKFKTAVVFLIGMLAFGLLLYPVFQGFFILPQFFQLGPLAIHYYGIFMALAVSAGWYVSRKRADRFGINPEVLDNIIFWVIIAGFIGARLYHVISSFSYYTHHPLQSFAVWNGGLSIYGAVLGGVIGLVFYCRFLNIQYSILNILAALTPGILIGQIIGRFGNFFNYELYGYPTSLPWKMFVPEEFREALYSGFSYFHPLFLYEALGNAVILFIFWKFFTKQSLQNNLFFWYLLLYNILRFGLEFLRIDSVFVGSLRVNALVSLGLIIIAIGFLTKKRYV